MTKTDGIDLHSFIMTLQGLEASLLDVEEALGQLKAELNMGSARSVSNSNGGGLYPGK